jgi:probable HAF family extracellular repeat protein
MAYPTGYSGPPKVMKTRPARPQPSGCRLTFPNPSMQSRSVYVRVYRKAHLVRIPPNPYSENCMKSSGGCDLRLCMSALCLAGLAAPALFGDSVSLADLAPLLGTNLYSSQASSINDEGDVVGTAYYGSTGSTYYTFFYSGTGQQPQMTIINSLYSNTPGLAGAGDSQPTGLGATGEVSGVVYNSSHVARAFLYENKDLTDLGTLGAANNGSFGYGVNDSGMVVGGSFVDSSVENVFSDSGAMANLQKPTGAFSAYGQYVDDSGQIAGYSNASGGQAFFYDPTDQIYT